MKVNLFDSDGNVIDGPFDLDNEDDIASIGIAIVQHYRLVASTTQLNRTIGVPDADEPFVTIVPATSSD
jgi:hypothetical protein